MKRLKLSFLIVGILALGVSLAYAQSPVETQPYGINGGNASLNITSTNAFQSIWPASTAIRGRRDCIIQNNGASNMFLNFGPIASALTTNSLTLAAGTIYRCGNNGMVTKDAISITGTISQNFFAIQY